MDIFYSVVWTPVSVAPPSATKLNSKEMRVCRQDYYEAA